MLSFEEWKIKFYRPPVIAEEDLSQDPNDCRRALKKDQEEQYGRYAEQFEEKENNSCATASVVQSSVAQPKNNSATKKKDAQWWKNYRARKKIEGRRVKCPACGHEFRKL